jgi:sugar (pentulose or hexulose) kinase
MIAIFDIGKTNKKCFVFDEDYHIVFEKTAQLPETADEDGDPCEDVNLLRQWVESVFLDILEDDRLQIQAVNVTTYGASFVYLNAAGQLLTPLYNYLKPFPEALRKQFFDTYGSAVTIALETASPVLGNLNAGFQLYALKYQKPLIFNQIEYALHLPQFITSLFHDQYFSEMTSIGCHTLLWNFQKKVYHDWVKAEGLTTKFPPIQAPNSVVPISIPVSIGGNYHSFSIGSGLHDSSAALIPYLACFDEPFVLISTGTWCISLNPFNQEPLTAEELAKDCLCYLSHTGKPVKAARYFGGNEHEKCIKGLAQQFNKPLDYYKSITYNEGLIAGFRNERAVQNSDVSPFEDYETAYHFVVAKIFKDQYHSTKLVLTKTIQRIFVDGGFSKNEIYMTLLAKAFPKLEVHAAEVAQATALGAAIAMHDCWNKKPLPKNLIILKKIRV